MLSILYHQNKNNVMAAWYYQAWTALRKYEGNDENTYTGTSYTLVDIKDYLQGSWETPETHELTSAAGSKEYIVSARKTYVTAVQLETIEFEKAIKEGISTGEYKLVFKAYSDDTLVQTIDKTFIVTK